MNQEINEKCIARIKSWKEGDLKPGLEMNEEIKIPPDNDKSILSRRFEPSNKISSAVRWRIQGNLLKHISNITNDNDFNKIEANLIELDIFHESTGPVDYQKNSVDNFKFFNDQEKLLKEQKK